jgi:hypothetical protein
MWPSGILIAIELKTTKMRSGIFFVSESPVHDTTLFMEIFLSAHVMKNLFLNYFITYNTGAWLYVYCNEVLALRYKLNVKKEDRKSKWD